MTIERLATQGRKYIPQTLSERNYEEIFKSRNNTLRNMLVDKSCFKHKNEIIATIKGVNYIDDAKSITSNSSWFTLEMTSNPVIWILEFNGDCKQLSNMKNIVKQKVHTLIIISKQSNSISQLFTGLTNVIQAEDVDSAVKTAYYFASAPDFVVYSPASGNEEDIELKGNNFAHLVRSL